jgi:hypothetical protein
VAIPGLESGLVPGPVAGAVADHRPGPPADQQPGLPSRRKVGRTGMTGQEPSHGRQCADQYNRKRKQRRAPHDMCIGALGPHP